MGRTNKYLELVFANIIGLNDKISLPKKFLSRDPKDPPKELSDLKKIYSNILYDIKNQINDLAKLEIAIAQRRCKDLVDHEVKLSLIRKYIYARTIFVRDEKEVKDIRCIIGKTSEYGDNLNELYKNDEFMSMVKEKLINLMDKEIKKYHAEYIESIIINDEWNMKKYA